MSIEEAWARVGSTPGGSRVSIRGPLGAFYGGICTLMNCPERGCCNKCITLYGLGSEAALREHRYEETIQLKGPRIGCTGDESLQCCEFEASGQEVIAQGTVQKPDTNRYSLEDATICVPSSP